MDWDKANFQKINQRKAESKRWEKRDEVEPKKFARKGSKHHPSKRKKRR
jgi:hypothetical protein